MGRSRRRGMAWGREREHELLTMTMGHVENKKDVIYDDGKFLKSYSEGDVLIMTLSYNDRKGRFKNIGHTGVVVKVGKTSVRTIEGNTNDLGMRDSRTGDGVYVKIRPLNKSIQITRWAKSQN